MEDRLSLNEVRLTLPVLFKDTAESTQVPPKYHPSRISCGKDDKWVHGDGRDNGSVWHEKSEEFQVELHSPSNIRWKY